MSDLIREEERLDDLEINNLKIIQNPKVFCFGIDAVLLSDFAVIKQNASVMDLCSGNAVIPLLLSAKSKAGVISALEYQEDIANMAKRSVKYNGLEALINIDCGDVKNIRDLYKTQSFDVVTCNPPYMPVFGGLKNDSEKLSIARHEIKCKLEDGVFAASYILKYGGKLFMVHKPHRLPEIIQVLVKYGMEPKRLRTVHPFEDKEPNMILVEAVKGGKPWLKIEAPLIVYNKDRAYTEDILRIYGKA